MFFRMTDDDDIFNPETNCVYLVEDTWDDWFEYETLFYAVYYDEQGEKHDLGNVKIGKKNIGENEWDHGKFRTRMSLFEKFEETKFERLPEDYFSLGQNLRFYSRLNDLGDKLREEILEKLNDIAYNEQLFSAVKNLPVTKTSIMRSVSATEVKRQYKRVSRGGVDQTPYNFSFSSLEGKNITPYKLEFDVRPGSNPPTNIHVIIGRNGIGKTYLLRNMINSLYTKEQDKYGYVEVNELEGNVFSNIICVGFSAFDIFPDSNEKGAMPYLFIGLNNKLNKKDNYTENAKFEETVSINTSKNVIQEITTMFMDSVVNCIKGSKAKKERWIKEIEILEEDLIFKQVNIRELESIKEDTQSNEYPELRKKAGERFNNLSSGHKIILLIITQLVEKVEESTLVLLDEPETHLHPPLLSAFIRALSALLIDRNGVAIITTHSPVVLQEVPRECVWKLSRIGFEMKAERLEIETFGENVGILTNEVFGLEVRSSGFYSLLLKEVEKEDGDYNAIMSNFNGKLGSEARILLKILSSEYKKGDWDGAH